LPERNTPGPHGAETDKGTAGIDPSRAVGQAVRRRRAAATHVRGAVRAPLPPHAPRQLPTPRRPPPTASHAAAMGASVSVPQRLFAAIRIGDTGTIKAMLSQVRRSSSAGAQRRALFTWVDDASGMTCLMLAAARGYTEAIAMVGR
jgi:hypothetical protein